MPKRFELRKVRGKEIPSKIIEKSSFVFKKSDIKEEKKEKRITLQVLQR